MKNLSKIMISNMVKDSDNEITCLLALYKQAFPNFDKIKSIESWPKVSQITASYILAEMHTKFDASSVNMLWLNKGFGSKEMNDFKIDISECKVIF